MNSDKFFLVTAIIVCWLFLVGCGNRNVQSGKFAVSTDKTIAIEGVQGQFVTLNGNRLNSRGEPSGQAIALLNIVVVVPETKGIVSSQAKNTQGSVESNVNLEWILELGKIGFQARWNRATDVIEINGTKYDRTAGNSFLAIGSPSGKFRVVQILQQIENVDPNENFLTVIKNCPDAPDFLSNVGLAVDGDQ